MRAISIVLAAGLLTGCGTAHPMDCLTGFLAWNDCPAGSAGYERRAQAEAQDDTACRSYGLEPGTDGYTQCRITFRVHRDDRNQAALNAALSNLVRPSPVLVPPPVVYHPYQPAPSTSCISNAVGNSVYTTCN